MALAFDPPQSSDSSSDHDPGPRPRALPLESIADTVRYTAGAVDGLQDVLRRLESSITRAHDEREVDDVVEARLGVLFSRAQAFVDGALSDAGEQAKKVMRDAEREAARLVAAGHEEAERLVEEAKQQTGSAVLLGQLFTHAQAFLDGVLADANKQGTTILRDAESEAARLVAAGHEEAQRLVEAAKQQTANDLLAVQQLGASIETFNRVNAELAAELSLLQQALAIGNDGSPEYPLAEPPQYPLTDPAATEASEPDIVAPDGLVQDPPTSPTSGLSGAWMDPDGPLWEPPREHEEPRARFWRRQR